MADLEGIFFLCFTYFLFSIVFFFLSLKKDFHDICLGQMGEKPTYRPQIMTYLLLYYLMGLVA